MDYRTTIYLDTSVPNFLFADDAPEKKENPKMIQFKSDSIKEFWNEGR